MHDGAVSAEVAAGFEFDGPVRRDGDWSWIVFANPGSGDRLGLDLRPADGGQVGQVLSIVHDPDCLFVLAPSYRAWFETLVQRTSRGSTPSPTRTVGHRRARQPQAWPRPAG